jgi:G protein beta subunit-like protein
MQSKADLGPWLVTAAYDLSISSSPIFADSPPTSAFKPIMHQASQVNRLVVSPENRIAAAANMITTLYEVQQTGIRQLQFSGHQANVTDVAFVGADIYSCSEDRTWQFSRFKENVRPALKISAQYQLNGLVILPTQQHLVTCDEKGHIELWDIRNPRDPVLRTAVAQGPVRSIALARDGTRLVAGCHDGSVRIMSVAPDRVAEEKRFEAHGQPLLRVVISPDDATFVTVSADGSGKLWNFEDSTERFTLKEADQKKWVWDAAYTEDGEFVVTVGTDRFARTWNCATGKCVYSSNSAHQKGIIACAMWPNNAGSR